MNMAEKMGVFSVLKNMHSDAEEKLSWRERKRLREKNGENPINHTNAKHPDSANISNNAEIPHSRVKH